MPGVRAMSNLRLLIHAQLVLDKYSVIVYNKPQIVR